MSELEPPPDAVEYTIDELAAAAKVPSRTIRFYQAKGALKPPRIKGRVAYYGDEHKERLALIASLQDRGLRIDAIRELVGRIDRGELDLAEWLGVEEQLQTSWGSDRPRTVTEPELYELAGSRRAGLLSDLARLKLAKRHGDTYVVNSPALLHTAVRLERAGIDLETTVGAGELIRKNAARLAAGLAAYFVTHVEKHGEDLSSEDMPALLQELRAAGMETVRLIFAQEMDRELRALLESGRASKLPRKKKK